jgi:hypothetical protein
MKVVQIDIDANQTTHIMLMLMCLPSNHHKFSGSLGR